MEDDGTYDHNEKEPLLNNVPALSNGKYKHKLSQTELVLNIAYKLKLMFEIDSTCNSSCKDLYFRCWIIFWVLQILQYVLL